MRYIRRHEVDLLTRLVATAWSAAAMAAGAQAGWVPLFDGKSLAGWTVRAKGQDRSNTYWSARDGALEADSMAGAPKDYVWLVSEKEYGDFALRLSFQAFRDSPGNSGVQLRSRYDEPAGWLDGPQVDVHPREPWRTGMIWDETRGSSRWLYPVIPKGTWVKPEQAVTNHVLRYHDEGDGWNRLEILARGAHLRATLNGVRVMDWDGAGVLDDELHRARRVGLRGHVALQIHRGDRLRIRYRDLAIRELPPVAPSAKKLIEMGWDQPDTAFLRANLARMEEAAPFDGVVFHARAAGPGGAVYGSDGLWSPEPWPRAAFAAAAADLRACAFTRFLHNFLRVNCSPAAVDWFDDAGWRALAEKLATMAWIGREGGARGLAFDPESYGEKVFRWRPDSGRSFAETAAKARARGAQAMQAMAAEFPDLVFLSLWLNSLNLGAAQSGTPEAVLAASEYGLFPAFFNGLLDAAPPSVRLVDGGEHAYRFEAEADYLAAYNAMKQPRGAGGALVAPENRDKFRAQILAGFGFYLDCYLNETNSPWHIGAAPGGTRLERLAENLEAAARVADEYVWVYGEQGQWWPMRTDPWFRERVASTPGKGRAWEEAMPGITRAIARARAPAFLGVDELEAALQAAGQTNLAANGGFDEGGEDGLPRAFHAWQDDGPKGVLRWDAEAKAARAEGVRTGCFLQDIPARPGERYAVAVRGRAEGAGAIRLTVRWQTAEGRWAREDADRTFGFLPAAAGGLEAGGVVRVPAGAGRLVVLLAVSGGTKAADRAWFDDLRLAAW